MAAIFTFESRVTPGVFAFAGDAVGSRLPPSHSPWAATGSFEADAPVPHRLDRETIETAIDGHGYQLWRLKGRS